MTCRRLVLCLLFLYRWPFWLLVEWLAVTPLFQTSSRQGQSWWVPWNLLQIHPSLLVYGSTRLTHKASHRVRITILGGRWPYFSVRLLFTWHDLHDFVTDWAIVLIPFLIYCSVHCHFKTVVPRVLKIVMVPHCCLSLQRLCYPAFLCDRCIFDPQ